MLNVNLNLPISSDQASCGLAGMRNVPGGSFKGKNEMVAANPPPVSFLRRSLSDDGANSPSSSFFISAITDPRDS